MAIFALAVLGFLLSCYALYVRQRSKAKNYHALCDINDHISCTKAFGSQYGITTGIPNPVYGIVVYPLVGVLTALGKTEWVFWLVTAATMFSIRLAYLSYWKQRNFCVVCTTIYAVNVLLFIITST